MLLYLSHSDEVELIATFTPADVISVLRLGSRRVEEAGIPAGIQRLATAHTHVEKVYIKSLTMLVVALIFSEATLRSGLSKGVFIMRRLTPMSCLYRKYEDTTSSQLA